MAQQTQRERGSRATGRGDPSALAGERRSRSAHRSAGSAGRTGSPTWRGSIVAIVALLLMLAATALIEILRLGGVSAADVSHETSAWFAPADYVFMIWTVLYIALAVWCVGLAGTSTGDERFAGLPISRDVVLFCISCALNIIWLILWHLRIALGSVIVIIALLAVVSALYLSSKRDKAAPIAWMPLSLYVSWLLVATVANIAHAVAGNGAAGTGIAPALSTILLILALLAVAYVVRLRKNDIVFPLPIAWAGIGVGVRVMGVSVLTGVLIIALTVLGAAAIYIPWDRVSISKGSGR